LSTLPQDRRASQDPIIRWQQRFANYGRALEQLELFFEPPALSAREQRGLIKAFASTFELALNSRQGAGSIGQRYNQHTVWAGPWAAAA
jgi:hypothetical protein